MPRPAGLPKTGGRKPGTPNRKTQALTEKLAAMGCDPIEGLAGIAMDANTSPELRVRCFSELAQYVYPKRKAVDIAATGPNGEPSSIRVEFVDPITKRLLAGRQRAAHVV
jgi:hypothetical protein